MDPTNKSQRNPQDDGEGRSQDNSCAGRTAINQSRWDQREPAPGESPRTGRN